MTAVHQPVYIPSIQAADIYNNMHRDRKIKVDYVGMIPSSLELNKLIEYGLKTREKKNSNKLLSDDLISVKFKFKVDSGTDIVNRIEQKKENISKQTPKNEEKRKEYIDKLDTFVSDVSEEMKDEQGKEKWKQVKLNELRKDLYMNGFDYNGIHYVVYKRSSAKSRIGQCLFIKEKLYKKMIDWARMGIDFESFSKQVDIDFPSLLAYESLVGSSIEKIIKIHPKNILIVSDVDSRFMQDVSVVKTSDNGFLDSFPGQSEVKNSIFDGESLLDCSYFENGKSMMLLRNHMFKSASFNCNIQKFLMDNCPEDIRYEDWKIKSLFDEEQIYAKDIHLIITPTSLKALKFSDVLSSEYQMWHYWKQYVLEDGYSFGVCKSEKATKRGENEDGSPLQQTSYQMLNSIPLTEEDMEDILEFEKKYIKNMKDDNNIFIKHLQDTKNMMNLNAMFVDIYIKNKNIAQTKIFKDFKKKTISSYINHIKHGKIRLAGDYCVMLGNPMEFLYHSIGKFNTISPISMFLHKNEIYTKLFGEGKLVGFRNPHTAPSNVLLAENVKIKEIDYYFNLTKNIACVNSIDFAIQDILSGCDFDSDTLLLLKNETITRVAESIWQQYRVCTNEVKSHKTIYPVNKESMCEIDSKLSESQKFIGRTVNTGQLCMSEYWDVKNSSQNNDYNAETLLKKVDVVTVLSSICIDMAKKMFDIEIDKEIDGVKSALGNKDNKPLFWKYVSMEKKPKTEKYNCPMDILFEKMDSIAYAERTPTLNFDLVLHKISNPVDYKQAKKVADSIKKMSESISNIMNNPHIEKEDKFLYVEDVTKYYDHSIAKLKISQSTMGHLILLASGEHNTKNMINGGRLLKSLYDVDKEHFLANFI